MRPPLIAALAALALVPSTSYATGPGAGTVAMAATMSFRPGIGIVVAGTCTYAGLTLSGEAASATFAVPGQEAFTEIECDIYDAAGLIDGFVGTSGGNHVAVSTRYPLGGRTPTRICGRVRADSLANGVPTATSAYTCLPVVPGPVAVS